MHYEDKKTGFKFDAVSGLPKENTAEAFEKLFAANKAEVEPVAHLYKWIGDASDSYEGRVVARSVAELKGEIDMYPDSWERIGPLYATPPATTGGANATPTGASTANPYQIPGLGRITQEDDGFVTLQFVDGNASELFMQYYEPTVDCEQMPPNKSVGASTVLTDAQIMQAWASVDTGGNGPELVAFGRAVERLVVAAQAGQVAVPGKSEARYQWLRDWFLRGGARLEIDPWGHVRVTTAQMVDEAIDAALAAPSPAKESK